MLEHLARVAVEHQVDFHRRLLFSGEGLILPKLLILRDLLIGPRRFTDLLHGLPGIPTNILSSRLKELEAAGVVRRSVAPTPRAGVVYELTPYGAELEEAVAHLGRWGAKSLGEPPPGEIVTAASLVMALRTTFRPQAARSVRASFELRVGPIVLHAHVANGRVHAAEGPLAGADLVIEAGPGIRALMAGEIAAEDAIAHGLVNVTGDPALLTRFAQMFRIDPKPETSTPPRP